MDGLRTTLKAICHFFSLWQFLYMYSLKSCFFFLKVSFVVGLCFVAFKENCTHEHSIDWSCLLVNVIIDFHVDWVK